MWAYLFKTLMSMSQLYRSASSYHSSLLFSLSFTILYSIFHWPLAKLIFAFSPRLHRDYSFLFQFLASRKLFEQINRASSTVSRKCMTERGVSIQSKHIFMHTRVIEKVSPLDLVVVDCSSVIKMFLEDKVIIGGGNNFRIIFILLRIIYFWYFSRIFF